MYKTWVEIMNMKKKSDKGVGRERRLAKARRILEEPFGSGLFDAEAVGMCGDGLPIQKRPISPSRMEKIEEDPGPVTLNYVEESRLGVMCPPDMPQMNVGGYSVKLLPRGSEVGVVVEDSATGELLSETACSFDGVEIALKNGMQISITNVRVFGSVVQADIKVE